MIQISSITRERWYRFKSIKRSYYSLWMLSLAFVLSLFAEFWAGDKPILMKFDGEYYFPIISFYSDIEFGGSFKTEANYLDLKKRITTSPILGEIPDNSNWMILPIIPHDPLTSYLDLEENPPHAPSFVHYLGTDSAARDVLSRLIHGFRICMLFSLVITTLGVLLGIVIGGIQGYIGGKTDLFMQRGIEVWSQLPFLYVIILIAEIYGRGFWLLVFIMCLFQWIGLSYYMRGEFLKLKQTTYVKSAKALGLSSRHIFFREILPNALTPLITLVPFSLIGGISLLTSLDFLGFGLQPPTPSWGELLNQGWKHLYAPWITLSTLGALSITLLLTTFIGEGVREAFDPRGKK
tara:strand:+ start:1924 stop:2973 length:1050 start_codon:yes stop_codon:yes gene_type:complete